MKLINAELKALKEGDRYLIKAKGLTGFWYHLGVYVGSHEPRQKNIERSLVFTGEMFFRVSEIIDIKQLID